MQGQPVKVLGFQVPRLRITNARHVILLLSIVATNVDTNILAPILNGARLSMNPRFVVG